MGKESALSAILGAIEEVSTQRLSIYIPNKDMDGKKISHLDKWIMEAQEILTEIGGGATSFPSADGSWKNPASGEIIFESTKLIYTYIRNEEFIANIPKLKDYLYRFGRETNQGEVIVEFDGRLYKIQNFDAE